VLAFLAAALAASTPSPALETSVPWWERITVTVDDKGKQQSCLYETNLSAAGGEACGEAMASTVPGSGKTPTGLYSKLTFERRFSPGGQLDAGKLQPGDTLIGRQVMFLTSTPRAPSQAARWSRSRATRRPTMAATRRRRSSSGSRRAPPRRSARRS